ncbi:MAG: proteasome accessory factor PafA2 family protein, partial [Nitrospira sp.]|nr:proteasome accessory factor PafA2 family protein [Nitrospira sp.]
MHNRIFGIETEYGLLIKADQPDVSSPWIAHRIIEHLFGRKKHGVIDWHYRGHDEPPGNGGFLLNAGRMYVDMGHLEYASPECHSLWDLVAADRAGDWLLQDCLDELGLSELVSIIKNNIDHETDATFGCHENYLVTRDFPFTYQGLGMLMPFLVTRQVFTGAGRIGKARSADGWIALDDIEGPGGSRSQKSTKEGIIYQISQRPDYIVNDFFEWVQHNRAIVNTRDEPLADPERFRRLHLLMGDSNMAEEATLLKMGTTGLVLQLIEEGYAPQGLDFDDPVQTLRAISHDPEQKWMVTLSTGRHLSALDIQEQFWEAAAKQYAGQDEETDWVLAHWESVV